jgi:mannose-6-phosphate isomerase
MSLLFTVCALPAHNIMLKNQKPWGNYQNLIEDSDYKLKRIEVAPGGRLSYQKHSRRAEHWVVVRGTAIVTIEGIEHCLKTGDSIDIPVQAAHRLSNPGTDPLLFVEVQFGDYFGEDDIIRLEDDYGRTRN